MTEGKRLADRQDNGRATTTCVYVWLSSLFGVNVELFANHMARLVERPERSTLTPPTIVIPHVASVFN